ncbi:unnamed protein product [Arctogadus glacialis]
MTTVAPTHHEGTVLTPPQVRHLTNRNPSPSRALASPGSTPPAELSELLRDKERRAEQQRGRCVEERERRLEEQRRKEARRRAAAEEKRRLQQEEEKAFDEVQTTQSSEWGVRPRHHTPESESEFQLADFDRGATLSRTALPYGLLHPT